MRCLPALARVTAPAGRGARTLLDAPDGQILLIDESYNANPASVRAALAAMAATPRETFRAASPCWATCWSWARRPPTCIAG